MSRTLRLTPGRRARLLATGLLLVAGGLASAGWAPTVGAQACGPAPDGRVAVAVAVVVDTGSGAPLSRCVVVDADSTGAVALAAAIGGDRIRVGDGTGGKSAGFVCGLVGVPATGCTSTGTQPTWNYWHAAPGGTWRYSNTGFADYRVPARCAVEGWSYGLPYTEPRIPPPAVTCEQAPAPTTAPRPAAAPPVPTNGSWSTRAPSAAAGAAPSAAGATTVPGTPNATPSGATSPAGTGSSAAAPNAATAGGADPAASVAGATTVPAPTSTTDAPITTGRADTGDEVATAPLAGRSGPGAGPDTGAGPGTGLLVGLAAAAVLAAVAVVRSRRGRIAAEQGV